MLAIVVTAAIISAGGVEPFLYGIGLLKDPKKMKGADVTSGPDFFFGALCAWRRAMAKGLDSRTWQDVETEMRNTINTLVMISGEKLHIYRSDAARAHTPK